MDICLNMIVKDEAPIIEECLRNVCDKLPIKYWAISDTGSTDGTQDIIKNFFEKEGIPGELHEDEWKNFAHNRSVALTYARGKCDYTFFFDADDRIKGDVPLPENPDKDTYYLELKGGNITWERIFLVRSDWFWQWVGVVHEVIAREKPGMPYTSGWIKGGYNVIPGHFGNRSQATPAEKYGKDAVILEEAFYDLENREDEWGLLPRYAFYCGQSWRNVGDLDKTIYWYKKRTEMGGWREEVGDAYANLGDTYLKNGQDELAIATWMQGYDHDQTRAECIYKIAEYYYNNEKNITAHTFLMTAKNIRYPENDRLFVSHHLYNHKIDYLLSITTWYYNSFYGIENDLDATLKIFQNLYKHIEHYKLDNIISNMKCYFHGKNDAELLEMLLNEKQKEVEVYEV